MQSSPSYIRFVNQKDRLSKFSQEHDVARLGVPPIRKLLRRRAGIVLLYLLLLLTLAYSPLRSPFLPSVEVIRDRENMPKYFLFTKPASWQWQRAMVQGFFSLQIIPNILELQQKMHIMIQNTFAKEFFNNVKFFEFCWTF